MPTARQRARISLVCADARVAKRRPTVNFGTTPTLDVDGSPDVESDLRFSVSGLTGAVSRATLRLWVTDKSANGPGVYPAGNDGTETGITWKNRPARTGPKAADLGAVAQNSWVELDVTSVVTGAGDWGFALAGSSSDGAVFSSREGANPPQLVVATDEAPPPPPPPPRSSTGSRTSTIRNCHSLR
jgi:hypothetical protein